MEEMREAKMAELYDTKPLYKSVQQLIVTKFNLMSLPK